MGKYPGLNQRAGPIVQAKIYGCLSVMMFAFCNWLIYKVRHSQLHYTALGQLSSHATGFTLIQALGRLQWSVRYSGWKSFLVSWLMSGICCFVIVLYCLPPVVCSIFVGQVLPWAVALLRGALFLGELLRKKSAGDADVQWEYCEDAEWRPFPPESSRLMETRFLQTDEADSSSESGEVSTGAIMLLTVAPSSLQDSHVKGPMQVCLPDRNAICQSHGEMCMKGEGSDEAWEVRRRWCGWQDFSDKIFMEGAALVMGFLVMQALLLLHTGYLHSVEGLIQKPKDWDRQLTGMILVWSIFFGILPPVLAKAKACGWIPGWGISDAELLRESCSSALAWCLVRGVALIARPHCSIMDTYIVVAFPLTWLAFFVVGLVYSVPHEEEVAHSIANAFGIVVGLAWDKAFESLVMHMTAGWNGHYVVSKVFLAVIVCVTILPGWYWYLVPRAHHIQSD